MEQPEDKDLIARCKSGSTEAFDALVLKYHKKVFNVAYRCMNNYDEANDIAQEVFVRVFRGIGDFREEASLFTWLYRITVNLSKNRLKSLGREQRRALSLDDPIGTEEGEVRLQIPDAEPSPREALLEDEKRKLIQSAIMALDDEFREVIILRDMEGLGYEEISQILKANIGTVKSRLHRARMFLKEKLKGALP